MSLTTPFPYNLTNWTDGLGTQVRKNFEWLGSPDGSSGVGFLQSGTGATARTVQAKNRDVVSVKDFGAVGDGVTDDKAAIQAAINSASPGAEIAFPTPSVYYNLKSGVTISTAGITLRGTGANALLKADSSASSGWTGITASANDVTITGLAFNPNNITNGVCIATLNTTRCTIRGNTFTNPKSGGVNIQGGTFDLLITENQFNGAGYGVLGNDPATGGRWTISNNIFAGGTSGDGIELNCPTTGVADVVISGNQIHDYTVVSATSGFGIACEGISRATIYGNVVRNCGRNGIHIETTTAAAATGVTIVGNVCSGTGQAGIEVQGETTGVVADVIIKGNYVTGCCTNPAYNLGNGGIECGSSTGAPNTGFGVKGLIISENFVTGSLNSAGGIYVFQVSSATFPSVISSNICRANAGPGIKTTSCTETIINGNRCYDQQVSKTQTYGLTVAGASTNLLVTGNDFNNNLTNGINDGTAATSIYIANLSPNGGSAQAFGPPSVPATTVAYQNGSRNNCVVYITAGAGSTCAVSIDGQAAATLAASDTQMFYVAANKSITLTYTSAPTWLWYTL